MENVKKNLTLFYSVWLITYYKPYPSLLLFCPICGQAKKAWVSTLLVPLGDETTQAPACMLEISPWPSLHRHHSTSVSFLCFLKTLGACLKNYPACLRNTHYVNNKHFYTLLLCVVPLVSLTTKFGVWVHSFYIGILP